MTKIYSPHPPAYQPINHSQASNSNPYTFRQWAFLTLPSVALTYTLLSSPLLLTLAAERPVLELVYQDRLQPLYTRPTLWSHLLFWTSIALFEALALTTLAVLEDVAQGRTRLRFFAVVGTLVGLWAGAECFSSAHCGVEWDTSYRIVVAGMRFSWTLVASVVLGIVSEGGLWPLREEGVEMWVFLSGVWRPEGWRWIEIGSRGRISIV